MRKKLWKRAAAAGLALTMSIGLSACGGGDQFENAALAKEHVYKMTEFELPEIDGDESYVQQSVYRDGMVYLLLQVYHWGDDGKYGGNNGDMRVISMKDDGTDIKMVNLEIPDWRQGENTPGTAEPGEDNAVPEDDTTEPEDDASEPEDDASEPGEDSTAPGNHARMPGEDLADPEDDTAEPGEDNAVPEDDTTEPEDDASEPEDDMAEPEIDTEMPIEDEYVDPGYYENSYYQNYNFGSDGKIYAIRNYSYENYASEENSSIRKNYISCWNSDGSFAWETEIENLETEDEYLYVNNMYVTDDGSLNLLLSGDNFYSMSVDAQGNVSGKKALPDKLAEISETMGNIFVKSDGTLLLTYYDAETWTKQFLVTYNPSTDTLGEASELPGSLSWNGYNTMSAGTYSDLVYCTNEGVYTFNRGDANSTEKMNFVNSDLYLNNISAMVELDANSFLGVFSEEYGEELKAGIFTYVDPKDIPDKAVIVLGGSYVSNDIKKRAIEFNRSSEEYRIVIKDYDSYNSYEDYNAGVTQLNNDIISGSMPDILITNGLPMQNYISKGLLADIGKLIEEDEELSQVEFVQNVFDAYSVNDRLYYIIPSFQVSTMVGKVSMLGDRTSWTMEDMMQLESTLPEGTVMFGEMTRDNFIRTMMEYCAGDFVDVETGKCDFDSQNFIAMMEYAKTLPEELGEDYYGEDYWENYQSQYRENRTIVCNAYIGRISEFNRTLNGVFGEDISYVGFPTESGMGSYVQADRSYAISARSGNIEGAWEFMRYYLTDEYQSSDNLRWTLPIRKDYFMKSAEEAMQKPYWTDEDGNKQEYDDTYYINGEEIPLSPMTREQLDKLLNFIFSIDKCYYNDEDIMTIINEEMPSFFTGQKSAQDVAKVIQSRAQIYVNEK